MGGKPVVVATLERGARDFLRVSLDEDRGGRIELRIVAPLNATAGVMIPGKEGLSLRLAQLPALIEALREAQAKAGELGLGA